MATKMQLKKGKKPNPAIIFVVLAVVSYVLGFPLAVTAFLAFLAYIMFKANKDGRSLKDLPIPPADDEQMADLEQQALSTDFGREPRRSRPDMFEQDSNDPFGEQPAPVFAEHQQRTPQPKPAPVHETSAPVVTRTTATRTRQSPYRTGGQNSSQLVKRLRSAEGFRQAIAAMTVLGPPRALDPYVSDPMQSTTLGAAKRIE